METLALYYGTLAAAYVRGSFADAPHAGTPLGELTERERAAIVRFGLDRGARLHRFKRTMGLARVQRVIGILRGLQPDNLLDIGSGRGTFLWPLLDTFPTLPVTAIDRDAGRVAGINLVAAGGVDTLTARHMDATALDFPDGAFDTATMLEVLEHIPDAPAAVREVIRVAKRFAILSVPLHEDDNPEHIHRFTAKTLTEMCLAAGARRVNYEYVLNHLIAIATL